MLPCRDRRLPVFWADNKFTTKGTKNHEGENKRNAMNSTFVLHLMIIFLFLTGCPLNQYWISKNKKILVTADFAPDPSIKPLPGNDPRLHNGIAYDLFSVDVEKINTIVVPPETKVFRTPQNGTCTLLLVKRQAYSCHPPEITSISDSRKKMGCCYQICDGVLTIDLFGNAFPPGHGYRKTTLEILVPESIDVIESDEEGEWIKRVGDPTTIRTLSPHASDGLLVE